jgi:hypothetical protein
MLRRVLAILVLVLVAVVAIRLAVGLVRRVRAHRSILSCGGAAGYSST